MSLRRTTSREAPRGAELVVAADRPAARVEFEAAVVDFFVGAAHLLGVPKSVAAIYGIVFASSAPLSFADIAARLDLSQGSISQGLRVLREVGALKEVSAVSDHCELFEPDLEMRKLINRFLENRLRKQLDGGRAQLAALGQAVPAGKSPDARLLRSRLKQLQTWHDKAYALLPIARTFLKLT